jgi:hypothetical protein
MPSARPVKSQTRGILFFAAAFVVVALMTFIYGNRSSVRWISDYQAGIQESEKLNKPALVCFYWKTGPFTSGMRQGTWRNPKVVSFIEENFVPILISLDDHPELARSYGADYDGACFIRLPDGTQSDQATHGNRPWREYIAKLQAKLNEMTSKKP